VHVLQPASQRGRSGSSRWISCAEKCYERLAVEHDG